MTGKVFAKTLHVAAGSQMLGTELKAQTKSGLALRVREIFLKMGTESKTWKIYKTWPNASGTVIQSILRQSTDANGAAAADTVADVQLTQPDLDVILLPGEQIQLYTSGATAALDGYVQYEEVDVSETRKLSDPQRTR